MSLNRPGGNMTGVSVVAGVLVAKCMQLLREVVPTAAVFALLVNPNNPSLMSRPMRKTPRRPHRRSGSNYVS